MNNVSCELMNALDCINALCMNKNVSYDDALVSCEIIATLFNDVNNDEFIDTCKHVVKYNDVDIEHIVVFQRSFFTFINCVTIWC